MLKLKKSKFNDKCDREIKTEENNRRLKKIGSFSKI